MEISPIDRVYAHITVTAKLYDGTPATIAGVDVAALPYGTDPTSTTTWTRATYAAGAATILVAGPAADPTSALPIPAPNAVLWIRVTDTPEVQAVPAGTVSIR